MPRMTFPILICLAFILTLCACSDDDPAAPVTQVPTRLELISGNGQISAVSATCPEPLVVRVSTQAGQPSANVQVIFSVTQGEGVNLQDTVAMTDASGIALVWVRFGSVAGPYQVQATAPGLEGSPVLFDLQAVAKDATILEVVSGNQQTGTVGERLPEPLVVRLVDIYDNPVVGTDVEWDSGGTGALLDPAVSTSDTAGLASTSWTLGTRAGFQEIVAAVVGQTYPRAFFVAGVEAGTPDSLAVAAGDSTGGAPGAEIDMSVQVFDAHGNIVRGATVAFALTEGDGSLSVLSAETDEWGYAGTVLTLGAEGTCLVTATCAEAAPVTLTARTYARVILAEPAVTISAIHLLWSLEDETGFAAFRLYRSGSADVDQDDLLLATFSEPYTTDYPDETVVNGTRYWYRLYVDFDDGFSLPSEVVTAVAGVRVELPGIGYEMVRDVARNRIWVSVPNNNSVVSFSASNFRVLQEIVVGSRPYGIDLSEDGSTLYCALNGAGAVGVLDIAAGTVSEIDVGTELGDPRTWDVLEYAPGELIVTANPGSSGIAYVVRVDRNNADAANVIANNRIIRASPVLLQDPVDAFVYVGAGFSPNSLYKLDMSLTSGPMVLEDDHGSVSGTSSMAINAAGDRMYLRSGQVLRTASFNQAGLIGAGVPALSVDGTRCYVGTSNYSGPQYFQVWDTASFLMVDEMPLADPADAMMVLDEERVLVLADDLVYGLPIPAAAR